MQIATPTQNPTVYRPLVDQKLIMAYIYCESNSHAVYWPSLYIHTAVTGLIRKRYRKHDNTITNSAVKSYLVTATNGDCMNRVQIYSAGTPDSIRMSEFRCKMCEMFTSDNLFQQWGKTGDLRRFLNLTEIAKFTTLRLKTYTIQNARDTTNSWLCRKQYSIGRWYDLLLNNVAYRSIGWSPTSGKC